MELLEAVIAQLKTITAVDMSVAGVAELEAATKATVGLLTPRVFVVLLAETAQPNSLITLVEQRIVPRFGVVITVPNTVTPLGVVGNQTTSLLQTVRSAIIVSLLGWAPTGYGPIEFVNGKMVQVRNNVLWWQDEFSSEYYICSS